MDLDKLATQFLSGGSAGAITAALITEGGTIMVGLAAATVAATVYAKGKVTERKQFKSDAKPLKNQPQPGKFNLKTLFNGVDVNHDFIVAIYSNDGEPTISIVGHKSTQIARKLEQQKVLLPMDEIFRLADYNEVRFISF